MPEPVTASVIAKKMAKGVISKVGYKILESIAPGIFSDKKKFEEIKKQLAEISKQLEEILEIARNTFELVERLPDIVSDLIDEQTLYISRTRIESSIQVYLSLNTRPNAISHDELTDLLQSWNILIDKEQKTWVINQLPRYGEYLLATTDGKLFNAVLSGIRDKKVAVERSHKIVGDAITSLAREAEAIINESYIRSGSVLDDEPWLVWTPESTRTRTVTRTVSMPCSACNGTIDHSWREQVPDTAWNNELSKKKNRLANIRSELGRLSNDYRSLLVSDEVLKTFEQSLINREDSIVPKTSDLKVVESTTPFSNV